MWPFSDFQYGFRSSRSISDLQTVLSDRIARAFNKSGATQSLALNISQAFDRVWDASLLRKRKSKSDHLHLVYHFAVPLSLMEDVWPYFVFSH